MTDNYHGEEVTDDFRILEDEQHSEVVKWLAAEDRYTEQRLGQLSSAEFIRQRLTELSNYERTSAPTEVAGHWFYLQNDGLQDQSVLYVRQSDSGAPHIVIDTNQLDQADICELCVGVRVHARHCALGFPRQMGAAFPTLRRFGSHT